MSRYTAYSANQVITTTAATSMISKKSTTAMSLAVDSAGYVNASHVALRRP